jgi:hypothetical protein
MAFSWIATNWVSLMWHLPSFDELQELDFRTFVRTGWWYSIEFWYVPLSLIVTSDVWVSLCLTYFLILTYSTWLMKRICLLHFFHPLWMKKCNWNLTCIFVLDSWISKFSLLCLNYFPKNYPPGRGLCISYNTPIMLMPSSKMVVIIVCEDGKRKILEM